MKNENTPDERYCGKCGLVPGEHPNEFFVKHFSAYAFAKHYIGTKKTIEIGFGEGYGMDFLSAYAKEIIGVDIAPENIPRAQKKYTNRNLSFLHYDGSRLPFPDKSFDTAISFQVIEHIPENKTRKWLLEIKRVLNPDGTFLVSTLNLDNAIKPGRPYEKNLDHEKEFTAEGLKSALKEVFPDVELFGLFYSPKHSCVRRLKKIGLQSYPIFGKIIQNYFDNVTVADFRVAKKNVRRSLDLYAVCKQ